MQKSDARLHNALLKRELVLYNSLVKVRDFLRLFRGDRRREKQQIHFYFSSIADCYRRRWLREGASPVVKTGFRRCDRNLSLTTNIPADKYLKSIGCEDTACARVWSSDVVLADSFAKGAWRYPISSYAQFHDQKISPSYFLQFIRTEIYPTTDGLAISNRRYQVEKASANSQFRAYIDQHADADEFHCAGVLNTKRLKRITVNL